MANLIEKTLDLMPGLMKEIGAMQKSASFATKAIHTAHIPFDHPEIGSPVIPPITLSTTFEQKEAGVYKYDYSRANNYSREILEETIAVLENGKYCSTYASGLAASTCVIQMLNSGDHVICSDDVYGGTNRLFRRILKNCEFTFTDLSIASNVLPCIKPQTRLIWIETPTNPTMKMIDIASVCKTVKAIRSDILILVDNTFLTSYFQRPLDLGADVVLHSLTKYMNGHGDVVMGALIVNDADVAKKLQFLQFAGGAVPSPFDCYLSLRGLRTLEVRMNKHMYNGLAVATFLELHPLVSKVIHPGLKSHPQYELGKKQTMGYSGMVTAYLNCDKAGIDKFMKKLKYFSLAESLGGFESLIEIPSIMTHSSVPENERELLGITDNMLRFSVGIEDVVDILNDISQALNALS